MTSAKDYRLLRLLEGNPIVDTRTNRGTHNKPGYVRPTVQEYVKRDTKWERRSIVGWDGEGANLDSGEHVYNLLANSNGVHIINYEGLSTVEVFEFFLNNSSERDINVIFGGSYDINMILKDVPLDKLQQLWDTGRTYWKYYRINWASRKRFSVQCINSNNKVGKSFVLWDVIGYFQSSFVVACSKWLGNFKVLEGIQEMKLKRSEFKTEDIEDIIEYNRMECLLLVELVTHLFSSLDEVGVALRRYDGAGSIAAALLQMHNIRHYKGLIPVTVNRQAQYAYSGGRIEAIKCGTTTKPTRIFRYDINSAYPFACLSLPSYLGAKWKKGKEWDGSNNSLVCVKYHFTNEAPFYPLWYRDPLGTISYPRNGYGVYWGAEIANLFKYYKEWDDFDIEWAINCTLADEDTKPFSFNLDLFAQRKKFKEAGSMASESLKLGMNSEYGKLVQQAGYREGRIPTYHQLLWGGQITAYTRANLFDAAMQAPNDVISFATDAVFTTRKLDLTTGDNLGEWSLDEFQGMTIVQAGVYFLDHGDMWYEKFRGFDKGSLNREHIVKCWKDGSDYEAQLTRFVGLGSALMSTETEAVWRTWRTEPRKLDIRPTGKRIPGRSKSYHLGLRLTEPRPNITPDTLSEPYSIEWLDKTREKHWKMLNGIPLDILRWEDEDGEL